jgi:hypothetical protein
MTQAEMKLAAHLLRQASDTYGNHGCNDLDLVEVLPDLADRQYVMKRLWDYNGTPEDYDPDDCDGAHDAVMMGFLADELDRAAQWCPTAAEQAQLPG